MTPRSSVSIALTSYNGARYIGEQLESLAHQTLPPAELIVCDDASTDGTLDIVNAFAAKAPFPVRAERNAERLGYRSNFMKAAGLCRSELIAFCDQDDVWMPHKLAECVSTFDNQDTLLTYHNASVTDAGLKPLGSLGSRAAPRTINPPQSTDPWSYGLGFAIVFRRCLMDFIGLWPQSMDFNDARYNEAHDQWFFFLASSLGTIHYLAEPLALYRQHGANTCGWHGRAALLKNTVANLIGTGVGDLELRDRVAGKRADILSRIAATAGGERARRASAAAIGYRNLEARYRTRRALYLSNGALSRMRQLAAFLFGGGYRSKKSWGVGSKALVRDIFCAILFPVKTGTAGK